MEEHGVTQTEHMATIEAHAVAQQVQQVHVATYTEHSMLSADEDSPSSPEDTSYDDSDILNSTAADEVTAHLAAAGNTVWVGSSSVFFLTSGIVHICKGLECRHSHIYHIFMIF